MSGAWVIKKQHLDLGVSDSFGLFSRFVVFQFVRNERGKVMIWGQKDRSSYLLIFFSMVMALLLAACGGGGVAMRRPPLVGPGLRQLYPER